MSERAKILLVDDDPDFVEATSTLLANFYQVITASDGMEGLEKAKAEKPDLIILDVVLPVLDGFEVYSGLKQNPELADIPVIMLTCLSGRPDKTLDVEDYIDKMELNLMELLERVHMLVG